MALFASGSLSTHIFNTYKKIHDENLIPAKIKRKVAQKSGGDYYQTKVATTYTYTPISVNFQGKSARSYNLKKAGIVKEGVVVYSVYVMGDIVLKDTDRMIIDDAGVDANIHGEYKLVNNGGDGIIEGKFVFKVCDFVKV